MGALNSQGNLTVWWRINIFGQTTIIIVHSAIMPTFKSLSLRSQPFYVCTKKNAVSWLN